MATSSQRKVHIEKHNKEISIFCDVCKKGFSHISNLRKHQQIHQGVKFQCDLCDKSFARMEGKIDLIRIFYYNISMQFFPGMKNHRRVHTNHTPYACQQCEDCFRTLEMLKNHSKTHQAGYKNHKGGLKGQKRVYNVIYDYSEVEEVAESVQQIIQLEPCSD